MRGSLLAVAVCTAMYAVSADAQVVTPNLPTGTQYQIVFTTYDSMGATDSVVDDYNSFVTAEANQSPLLAALNVQWMALVSTESTPVTSNATSLGLPIYNTAGIEVSSGNIYSGSLLSPILYNQFGSANNGTVFGDRNNNQEDWTGFATPKDSFGNSPEFLGLGDIVDDPLNPGHHNPFGSFYYPTYGLSGASDSTWSGYATGITNENTALSIYGISSPITVGDSVPEPAAWMLLTIGVGVLTWRLKS